MTKTMLAAIALFACLSQAGAGPVLSFEESLGLIRQQVLSARQEQVRAKSQALAQQIERLSREVQGLSYEASRLRLKVSDLKRRASAYKPDQPGRPNTDPFFRSDLQWAVWGTRDLSRDVESALREARSLSGQAGKDPELVAPAQKLARNSRILSSDCSSLESEIRWASWDFRRIGFSMEAWDLERESSDASRNSRSLEREAQTLLGKVQ